MMAFKWSKNFVYTHHHQQQHTFNIFLRLRHGSSRWASSNTTATSIAPLVLRNDNDEGTIATLMLNRPKHLNSLSSALLNELQHKFDELRNQEEVRVVILKGAGHNCFCAGHDLKEMLEVHHNELKTLFDQCSRIMMTLSRELPQPVIAQVSGVATAAGCQLVAACDLAVASQNAKFAVSGINLGLFCSTPAVALSRNIPRKHALHILMTGDFISAQSARDYGLVNKVAHSDNLENATLELAQKIASKSPLAIRLGKDMFYKQLAMEDLQDAYELACRHMVCNIDTEDAREGIAAFLEKRRPEWKGK